MQHTIQTSVSKAPNEFLALRQTSISLPYTKFTFHMCATQPVRIQTAQIISSLFLRLLLFI